jgi:hypothetical protein
VSTRRTGWRNVVVGAALAGAVLLPQTAYGQAATPTRPAATPTRAVTGSTAAGEPAQDIAMIAVVLGALIVGGFTLQRFATRRA